MSRYQPYPIHKDSGVDWIGDIPDDWKVAPLRTFFTLRRDIVGASSATTRLLSLTLHGVIERDLENPTGKMPASFDGYQRISAGEMVFCLFDIDETPRTVGVSPQDGMLTSAYTVFRVKSELWARYFYYFFLHIDEYKRLKPFYKGLRKTIRPRSFLSIQVPYPSEDTAATIVNLLDRETTRIDTLIAKKTRFIEFLKEKRQAVITKAVTKGLDDSVKMKDSGVEWIGQVPEHWNVARIKRLTFLRKERGNNIAPDLTYIGLEDVESATGKYKPKDGSSRLSDDSTVGLFFKDDVLYGKLRPYLRKAIVPDANGCCSTEFLVLRPRELKSRWLQEWLLTLEVTQQIEAGCDGAKMPRADWDHVGSIFIAYPDLKEQQKIINIIDRETSRIDTLITKTERSIELLKEKRSALITAAVTGKIDVREAA